MSDLLDRARESRKSPSVLKTRLIGIRSRDKDTWIFVFEGLEDVGIYEQWVRTIDAGLRYAPLPGAGKDQVLGLRQNLSGSTELSRRVLYFVDHDFDGLREHSPGTDLFCTCRYSVESYLVGEEVVHSFLQDELRCASTGDLPDPIVKQYKVTYSEFAFVMREVNRRLFIARRSHIPVSYIDEKVRRYVSIELGRVTRIYTDADLDALMPIPAGCDIDALAATGLDAEFDKLDPCQAYRGKFAVAFLRQWLLLIVADRRCTAPTMFGCQVTAIGFSPDTISLRSLASRANVPEELRTFLDTALRAA